MKYKVNFEFLNGLGEWIEDYVNCDGQGFCEEDALYIANEFRYRGHRNVRVEQMPQYKYGMRMRGYSPGCQPMRGLDDITDDPNDRYYDILVYDRELSAKEISDYELDALGEM